MCRPAYAKPLRKICNHLVVEAKCGKGPRVLWFEDRERCVLVVCVICQHDHVNRKLDWIEATLRGTAAHMHLPDASIVVDADTHTPLKVFKVRQISNDSLHLDMQLTADQESILNLQGGVCICGRSGTGKTEVIVKRMVRDNESCEASGGQRMFVAHSEALCNNARRIFCREAGPEYSQQRIPRFCRFVDIIPDFEQEFDSVFLDGTRLAKGKIDFNAFKARFWPKIKGQVPEGGGLSARLVWTKVQSVIKGSIELVQHDDQDYLQRSQYLKLGKKHDRLSPQLRVKVYDAFELYHKVSNASQHETTLLVHDSVQLIMYCV